MTNETFLPKLSDVRIEEAHAQSSKNLRRLATNQSGCLYLKLDFDSCFDFCMCKKIR